MSIRIVRLGSPREAGEGVRIGTVRRPPRGVPKSEYAKRDFYDVWLPNLSPSQELMKEGKNAKDEASWAKFKKRFRSQVNEGETGKILDLLAALSHQNNFLWDVTVKMRKNATDRSSESCFWSAGQACFSTEIKDYSASLNLETYLVQRGKLLAKLTNSILYGS